MALPGSPPWPGVSARVCRRLDQPPPAPAWPARAACLPACFWPRLCFRLRSHLQLVPPGGGWIPRNPAQDPSPPWCLAIWQLPDESWDVSRGYPKGCPTTPVSQAPCTGCSVCRCAAGGSGTAWSSPQVPAGGQLPPLPSRARCQPHCISGEWHVGCRTWSYPSPAGASLRPEARSPENPPGGQGEGEGS